MEQFLSDYYRLARGLNGADFCEEPAGDAGFFRFGQAICYGRCKSGVAPMPKSLELRDAWEEVRLNGSKVRLPFSMSQVIESLRQEHYTNGSSRQAKRIFDHTFIRDSYYAVRTLLPVAVRRRLQRAYLEDRRNSSFPNWPVDFSVDVLHRESLKLVMQSQGIQKIPFIWFWPKGAPGCLIMTHDVEATKGRDFSTTLMDIDSSYGIRASFQAVPEQRYELSHEYVQEIRDRGFEFNIHDLNHDGHLYRDRREFLRRAQKINKYVSMYNTQGFRSGSMYRNAEWYDAFEFSYDMSIPNVGHLEPQHGGCCTVMPYFIGKILELPLTTSEDYSVFHMLKEYSIDLWKRQLALIRQNNGLMSFIVHPDYVIELRARKVYETLLDYLQQMVTREKVWAALPGDVDRWWRARSQMRLVPCESGWEIEGPEQERARLAYAVLGGDGLRYEVAGVPSSQEACS